MNSDKVITTALSILAISTLVLTVAGTDGAIQIEDDNGAAVRLDAPPDHIISIGIGVTTSIIGLGSIDKIVVCDSYSALSEGPKFDRLRDMVSDKRTLASGNLTSKGLEKLKADINNRIDEGLFNKDVDVVIAMTSTPERLDFLKLDGFKNVLIWDTQMKSAKGIDEFIKYIGLICNSSAEDIPSIDDTKASIDKYMSRNSILPVKVQYIEYDNGFKLGSDTSLQSLMIASAGGDPHTYGISGMTGTIEIDLGQYVRSYPETVFLVDSLIYDDAVRMEELKEIVGTDARMICYEELWKSCSFYSSECVRSLAEALYPGISTYLDQKGDDAGWQSGEQPGVVPDPNPIDDDPIDVPGQSPIKEEPEVLPDPTPDIEGTGDTSNTASSDLPGETADTVPEDGQTHNDTPSDTGNEEIYGTPDHNKTSNTNDVLDTVSDDHRSEPSPVLNSVLLIVILLAISGITLVVINRK